jgi:hypothetical protein
MEIRGWEGRLQAPRRPPQQQSCWVVARDDKGSAGASVPIREWRKLRTLYSTSVRSQKPQPLIWHPERSRGICSSTFPIQSL